MIRNQYFQPPIRPPTPISSQYLSLFPLQTQSDSASKTTNERAVGSRPSRCRGLCPSRFVALPFTKRCIDGHRSHLDQMVLHHQAQEPFVRYCSSPHISSRCCSFAAATTNTYRSLASVNFLLFCVGATQVSRVLSYQASLKGETIPQEIESAAKAEGRRLEAVVKDPKGAIEKAEKA